MDNNYYYHVSNDPVSYMFFKKEYLPYLAQYHKLQHQYDNSPQLSKMFAASVYQNGALLIAKGEITITFNETIDDYIVFNDYSIDLITLKSFLDQDFIEIRHISSIDNFNDIVTTLSVDK